jgi:hypothetical protein
VPPHGRQWPHHPTRRHPGAEYHRECALCAPAARLRHR